MVNKYDVIVVGIGPADFLAAKASGENGLEVALLEVTYMYSGVLTRPA